MKFNLEQSLLSDLSQLIEQAQRKIVIQINSGVSMLFWQVGKRISEHILQNKRAEYGKEIVVTLSPQLSWSHFITLLPIKNPDARFFYAKKIAEEGWSVRFTRNRLKTKSLKEHFWRIINY